MGPVPILLEYGAAILSLLIDHLTEIGGVGSLIHNLGLGAGLGPVLIRRTGDVLTRSSNISEAMIIRNVDHRKRCHGGSKAKM